MNSRIITIILCIAVAGTTLYFFLRDSGPEILPPKNTTIVAFGDSLVEGVGATEGNDFVSLVSRKIGLPIINMGRGGDTTATALDRIDSVLALDPGIVILLVGGNDYLRRMPRQTTFENLGKIVGILKENDVRIVLLGVRGGLLRDTYESDFSDFAEREGLLYIPNVLDDLLGDKEFMSDQIHPNDKGYEKIADRVVPEIRRILKVEKREI